jgi:MFS family permease
MAADGAAHRPEERMSSRAMNPGAIILGVYRGIVVIAAISLLVWILLSGLVALVRNPYLILAFWLLGAIGMGSCILAPLSVLSLRDNPEKPRRPGRASLFLALAAVSGFVLWSQARPIFDGFGPEFAIVWTLITVAAIAGFAGLVVLPFLHWAVTSKEPQGPQTLPTA